eukprot:COSAG01_NODE_10899_length_2056_cov_1.291262_3_plen_148_part_00
MGGRYLNFDRAEKQKRKANAEMSEVWRAGEVVPRCVFVTTKDIKADQEILIDYSNSARVQASFLMQNACSWWPSGSRVRHRRCIVREVCSMTLTQCFFVCRVLEGRERSRTGRCPGQTEEGYRSGEHASTRARGAGVDSGGSPLRAS